MALVQKTITYAAAAFFLWGIAATAAFAQGGNFVPLSPIPNVIEGGVPNFGTLFNGLFKLLIVGAGVTAVVVIGWAGIAYMTTESMEAKHEAKDRILDAGIGLLIALSAFLILSTINPNLTRLDVQPVKITVVGEKPATQIDAVTFAKASLSTEQLQQANASVQRQALPGLYGTVVGGSKSPAELKKDGLTPEQIAAVEEATFRDCATRDADSLKSCMQTSRGRNCTRYSVIRGPDKAPLCTEKKR